MSVVMECPAVQPINTYGDQYKPTQDGRGVDISSQRQDELDRKCIDLVMHQTARGRRVCALDLGGGFGAHSINMAKAGASVTMIDVADLAKEPFERAIKAGDVREGQLVLFQKDFNELKSDDLPEHIDIIYSQRAIHYLPYDAAQNLLEMLFDRLVEGGALFLSTAGWDTEYGRTYLHRDKPVEERFCRVAPDMQRKHGIIHKIVIYRSEELITLLEEIGFTCVEVKYSDFGNVKVIARK